MTRHPDDIPTEPGAVHVAPALGADATVEAVVEAVGATLDALGIGHARLDSRWTITHVNATAEVVTQSAPGMLVGRNHWEVFPAAAGTEFERNYHEAVATGRTAVFRSFYPAPLSLWFEIRAVPHDGVLEVYFTDVTAQLVAEEGAAAGAERMGLVAGINADLIATLDVPATVAGLAPRLVPLLADGALITLIDRSGLRRDVSHAHREPRGRKLWPSTCARVRTPSPRRRPWRRCWPVGRRWPRRPLRSPPQR